MNHQTIVGIDFGTTNSVVSVLDEENNPKTLKIDNQKLLPSAVCFTDKGIIVGQVAKNMAIIEPKNTSLSIKRRMGEDVAIKLGENEYKPEEIAAFIFKKIKEAVVAELNLDANKVRAVITVPAYFTEEQREAVKSAASAGGFTVERIINEPTSASLAYGLNYMDDAKYAVYDLGGGTFDISVVETNNGIVEVLSTCGDNHLGGDDFDEMLAAHIWKQFIEKHKISVEKTRKIGARLKKIAEDTKIKLSTETQVTIQENFFLKTDDNTWHLEMKISRSDFENLISKEINRTADLTKQAIDDAELDSSTIDGIILVGGSCRIPMVSKVLEKQLHIPTTLIDLPDEAVSHGATTQGAIINKIDVDTILIDITPYSLGVESHDSSRRESAFMDMMNEGKQLPDDYDDDLVTSVIIPKNSPIPVKRTRQFYSVVPFQEAYRLKVYQGEHLRPEDNRLIGESLFEIKKPVDNGKIDITFELDISGILKMSAVEVTTKEKIEATFKSSRGKKIRKKETEEAIISLDDSTQNIIDRAEKLLKTKELEEQDKTDLKSLIEKYRDTKATGHPDAEIVENELLDLLYYIEDN